MTRINLGIKARRLDTKPPPSHDIPISETLHFFLKKKKIASQWKTIQNVEI